MRRVYVKDLNVGDVIGTNLYGAGGRTVVTKGAKVTKSIIDTIRRNNLTLVPIEESDDNNEIDTTLSTQLELLVETKEFKEFQVDYSILIEKQEKHFNRIKDGDTSEALEAAEDISSLISKNVSNPNLVSYLALAKTVSGTLYEHSISSAIYSYMIAKWTGFSPDDMAKAAVAGLFHDIGKINLPKEIIYKGDSLTMDEKNIMRTHPIEGYKILKDTSLFEDIKSAALLHHERMDHSGYPMHYGCDEIPTIAQIVGLAGAYDTATRDTPYKKAKSPFQAIESIEQEWFQRYDGHVVLPFLERIAQSYIGCTATISNKKETKQGIVQYINPESKGRPLIKTNDDLIDLSRDRSWELVQIK